MTTPMSKKMQGNRNQRGGHSIAQWVSKDSPHLSINSNTPQRNPTILQQLQQQSRSTTREPQAGTLNTSAPSTTSKTSPLSPVQEQLIEVPNSQIVPTITEILPQASETPQTNLLQQQSTSNIDLQNINNDVTTNNQETNNGWGNNSGNNNNWNNTNQNEVNDENNNSWNKTIGIITIVAPQPTNGITVVGEIPLGIILPKIEIIPGPIHSKQHKQGLGLRTVHGIPRQLAKTIFAHHNEINKTHLHDHVLLVLLVQ